MTQTANKPLKGITLVAIALSLILLPVSATNAATGWTPPVPVSGTIGSSYNPHMVVDSRGTLHMVWYDWVDLAAHMPYILYANKPAGKPWSSFSYLAGAQKGEMPAIAIGPDDTIHIVWASADFNPPAVDGPIKYVSRTVNGSWSAVQVVSGTQKGNAYPDVAVALNGTVHVAWRYGNVFDQENRGIYHAFKSGGGWSPPGLVYKDKFAVYTLIETDIENTLHVLIFSSETDYAVRYAYKPLNKAWSAAQELPFKPLIQSVEQLARDNQGNLHLVWGENDYQTGCNLKYSKKPLGQGWSWPKKAVGGDCQNVYIYSPSLTVNHEGYPVAAWTSILFDGEKSTYSAWYTFTDEGAGWSPPRLIDDTLVCENASSIAVDSKGGHHFVHDSGPVYTQPDGKTRGEIIYSYLQEPPSFTITTIITPESGGSLQSLSGDVKVTFPPGAVDEPVEISFTKTSFMPTANLAGIIFFELTAKTVSDGTPATTFDKPYTISVNYGVEGAGPAFEETLSLYYWDGFQWLQIPSVLNTGTHTVSAQLSHMTNFALLGETNQTHLPLVVK